MLRVPTGTDGGAMMLDPKVSSKIKVVLKDISLAKASAGKASVAGILDISMSRGCITRTENDEILARIFATTNAGELRDCDLIIEAVFEERNLKAQVIQEAEARIENTAVFATNTSTLPITSLAGEGKKMAVHPVDNGLQIMTQQYERFGKAHGADFYEYPPEQTKYLWPDLQSLFPARNGKLTQPEMFERLIFIQAIESVRCYEEGVVRSVADANIGSILDWGFAPFKGGTLQYINEYGVSAFTERAREMAKRYGQRFDPPTLLKEMAGAGHEF